jgi:hypothetical protein
VQRLVPVTRHTRNEKSAIKVVKGDPAKLQRDIFPTHTMTRIAELHAKGILGKGAAVCVMCAAVLASGRGAQRIAATMA